MKKIIKKIINEVRNTGERPILNTEFEKIDPVLQFAYQFAAKRIEKNHSVLDYGCGGGYGTEYLSRFTGENVVGFDIDKSTIKINNNFYKAKENLKFISSENDLEQCDLVTSFQVIEHLKFGLSKKYLQSIKNLVKENGTFLLATVNKNVTSYNLKHPTMPFHVYEYEPDELKDLLEKYYNSVSCFGQIDNITRKKVGDSNWSFKNRKKTMNEKILIFISQIRVARAIARHLPLFVKQLFFGEKKGSRPRYEYILAMDKKEIDNSYILIYECRNI